jgi:hypothetical protein
LYGSASNGAWNAGKTFQPCALFIDGTLDEVVPILTGGDFIHSKALFARICSRFPNANALERDVQDEPIESAIRDKEIASAAEYKQWD